jgi:hypothetical protein
MSGPTYKVEVSSAAVRSAGDLERAVTAFAGNQTAALSSCLIRSAAPIVCRSQSWQFAIGYRPSALSATSRQAVA